jgi:hypothetical protein
MNLITIVFLIAIVFMLTYDPKSGTLDKFIKSAPVEGDCQDETFRSQNPGACKDVNYESIQFASTKFMKPMATNSVSGAIIRQ